MWHHVASQVGRRGVAVRKDDGIAVALVDVGHPVSVDLAIVQLPVRFCPDHGVPPHLLVTIFVDVWVTEARVSSRFYRWSFWRCAECGCGSGQQPDDLAAARLITLAVTATSHFISPRVWSD